MGERVCTAEHYTPPGEEPRPRRAADGLLVCGGCARRLHRQLDEIPLLYDEVFQPRTGQQQDRISGTAERRIPLSDGQAEARELARTTLVSLVRDVVAARQVTPPAGLTRGLDTGRVCAFLRRHTPWMLAQADAGDTCGEVNYLHRELRKAARPSPPERVYIGDCPMGALTETGLLTTCKEPIYAYPQQGEPLLTITCAHCGTEQTVEEWQRRILGDTERHVTGPTLAALLSARYLRPVDPGLVRQWHHRGKIARLPAVDGEGRPLYDVDQVIAYMDTVWQPVTRSA